MTLCSMGKLFIKKRKEKVMWVKVQEMWALQQPCSAVEEDQNRKDITGLTVTPSVCLKHTH